MQTLEHRKCNHEDLKLLQARTAKLQKEITIIKQSTEKNKERVKTLNEALSSMKEGLPQKRS